MDIHVEHDVRIEGEHFALVVTTLHAEGATAMTAVHHRRYARHIGGTRTVSVPGWTPDGQRAELAKLSAAMTRKCAAAWMPADGQKSVVNFPRGVPGAEDVLAVLVAHERVVKQHAPGVTFGPDMGVAEAMQDAIDAVPDLSGSITGLSEMKGGLGIDEHGYTAGGLAAAVDVLRSRLAVGRCTIQGFGAVGAHFAGLVHGSLRVVAVSNQYGTLSRPDGLDIPALLGRWRELGDHALPAFAEEGGGSFGPVEMLFATPTDLFVPAARTSVLATRDELTRVRPENPAVLPMEDFLRASGTRVVLEGANAPLTEAAEAMLEAEGGTVLPDFIVNCGGLLGCWYELVERASLRADPGSAKAVHARARRFIEHVVRSNTARLLTAGTGARRAADAIVEDNLEIVGKAWDALAAEPDPLSRARKLMEEIER